MNIVTEIYHLVEELFRSGYGPPVLAGLAIGVLISAALFRYLPRMSDRGLIAELRGQVEMARTAQQTAEAENKQLKIRLESIDREREHWQHQVKANDGRIEGLEQRVTELSDDCERLADARSQARERLKRSRKDLEEAREGQKAYAQQFDEIAKSDGRVWLRPPENPTTRFLPLPVRRVPIISIANLKGGVGKTTITANLGAALADEGLRVLLIDLDYQSSLTSLCLSHEQQGEIKRAHRFIRGFFADQGDLASLNRCVTKVEGLELRGRLYLAAVDEEFADLEAQLMSRWECRVVKDDVRYRLRAALHDSRLREQYDVVLIDCPPRLTTGCINALAASDYALVPVLLESTSAEAAPRLIAWLRRLQQTTCPELSLLGVVGNRANPRAKLVSRQQLVWNTLQERCDDAWSGPVRLFDEILREHAAFEGPFAALDDRHRDRYRNLVTLIRRELPHACLQPSGIPALAGAAAGGSGA